MNYQKIIHVEDRNQIPKVAIKIDEAGKINEVPLVAIKIDNKGEIIFSPLKREGWSFAASMYMKSIINNTRSEGALKKKFENLTKNTGIVSREILVQETIKLAKRLDRQKIHLGNQFMRVMVTTGKTDPLIDLDKLKKRSSIKAILNPGYDEILFVNNKNSFIKIIEGDNNG